MNSQVLEESIQLQSKSANGFLSPETDRSYLQWRYERNPIRKYQFFSIKTKAGEGLIIYYLDSRNAVVEEILYTKKDIISLSLHELSKHLKHIQINVVSVGISAGSHLEKEFLKAGFIARQNSRKLLGIELNENMRSFNLVNARVFMFEGDMDI